jgi:hypothetical protein
MSAVVEGSHPPMARRKGKAKDKKANKKTRKRIMREKNKNKKGTVCVAR